MHNKKKSPIQRGFLNKIKERIDINLNINIFFWKKNHLKKALIFFF